MQVNVREAKVLEVILDAEQPISIREVAKAAFPNVSPVAKADSWVRNSVRRPTAFGWVRRVGAGQKPGAYKIDARYIEKVKEAIADPREPRKGTKTAKSKAAAAKVTKAAKPAKPAKVEKATKPAKVEKATKATKSAKVEKATKAAKPAQIAEFETENQNEIETSSTESDVAVPTAEEAGSFASTDSASAT